MRFVFILLVLLIATSAIAKPAKNACNRVCDTKYEPLCAKAKNESKERLLTFGNECVFENYNCEHANNPFVKKSGGECGNNVSVRLQ